MSAFIRLFGILIFILAFYEPVKAQRTNIRFEHISIEQGLSQTTVYTIIQDKYGFMWFGTEDGLNRFSGYDFKVYYKEAGKKNSISSSRVYSMCVDKDGTLWVGTLGGGLNQYRPETDDFIAYKNKKDDPTSISSNVIQCVFEDKDGQIWIGTAEGGLSKFDKQNRKFKNFLNNPSDPNSISHNVIRSIAEDSDGNLWLATSGGGLNKFDKKNEKFTIYRNNPKDKNSVSDDQLNAVFVDNTGIIWIGASRGGLNLFNPKTEKFQNYLQDLNNPTSITSNQIFKIFQDNNNHIWIGTYNGLSRLTPENREKMAFINYYNIQGDATSLSSNFIRSIFQDKSGIIWFGTFQDGICKFNAENQFFTHYSAKYNTNVGLTNNSVRSFAEDKEGNIWIGMYGGGVNKFNPDTEVFEHFKREPNNPNSLVEDIVIAVAVDQNNIVWIGTYGAGLNKYDPKTKQFTLYKNDPKNKNSISNNFIRSLYVDTKNTLWISTTGGGLNRFNEKDNSFTVFRNEKNDSTSLSEDRASAICEDHQGNIWVGTSNQGINKLNVNTGKFTRYQTEENNPNSFSSNRVFSIIEIQKNNKYYLLIGTSSGGLNVFDFEKNYFINYSKKDGLPNDLVYGVLQDDKGYLWLSSNHGLTRFNPDVEKDQQIRVFDTKDGLQSNAFNEGAYFKSKNGNLYFGGINGFNVFNPNKVVVKKHVSPVYIVDFRIFNDLVPISENSPLKQNIILTNEIKLTHNDYLFSFDFASLDYYNPEKNQYEYMLEGLDKTWNKTTSKRRFVTYTSIEPGTYTLKIRASNSFGIWNESPREIKIIIEPPIWKTWWFRTILVLVFISGIFLYMKRREYKLHEAKRILEVKVKERTLEIEQQKEELKSQAEQLERSNHELEKLSIVASETDNAVTIFDSKGNLEWLNKGYTRIYGYTLNDMVVEGKNHISKASSSAQIQSLVEFCTSAKKSISYEAASLTKEKEKLWIHTTLTPIFDSSGSLFKLIAIDSDITVNKEAEVEISSQKDMLQRQNEEIKASIRYAQTIQQAILPPKNLLDLYFENFIIFRPKDIVSGDFYWFAMAQKSKCDSINSNTSTIEQEPNQLMIEDNKETQEQSNTDDLRKMNHDLLVELLSQRYSIKNKGEKDDTKTKYEQQQIIVEEDSRMTNAKDKKLFLAVVDCTGHGVPGAFMSLIGNRILNEIINEKHIETPSLILETLNETVRTALMQNETDNNDGMDISLCSIERNGNQVRITFSGAKQKIGYYKQQLQKLTIFKGNRRTIGGNRITRNTEKFTDQIIELNKGDLLYLFSDGIIDQQNSERKRFGSTRFTELLQSNINYSLEQQKINIETNLDEYQKNDPQRDDITVIGVRF